MADVRPFTALRYDTTIAGDAANLVAPPYDVVSVEEAHALYARSPFNVARIENGEERPDDSDTDNRYTRSALDIAAWLQQGALQRDAEPHFYVYDQEFTLDSKRLRRRAVFAALRVEEWEKRIVLPHEHTAAKAKEDRLRLLRATRTHLSPIMAMYRDPSGAASIAESDIEAPVFDAVLPEERHTLRPLSAAAAARFHDALAERRLYIADGHHRYETALNYRNERRAAASGWTGEEPENFVLAALVDAADPGLVVLPIDRLLRLEHRERLGEALERDWNLEKADSLEKLLEALRLAGAAGNAYGIAGLERGSQHLVTPRDHAAIDAMVPQGYPDAWRSLDVAVLHHALLPLLGFEMSESNIAFTEDAAEAVADVEAGTWDLAVLLNPTRVDQIIDVAEAGERMPLKSTYFYPKLGTGLVLLPAY